MKKEEKRKNLLEFSKLAAEIKKWFEDREIDTGYTDTNVGHFALFIQDKLQDQKEEIIKNFEGIKAMDRKMLSLEEVIKIINNLN